jgi:phenylacetate-coenzyme A ligase PaaK-like adenylate-forming protein
LNTAVKNIGLPERVFSVTTDNFSDLALEVFRYQYANNDIYRQYCQTLTIDPDKIDNIEKIPYLPIDFFKTHRIITTQFEPVAIFESSGTTQTINSKHLIKDISLYEQSFTDCFNLFYGKPEEWCIIALLPSYLERNNSSLVVMAEKLIQQSKHHASGFYLHDTAALHQIVQTLEKQQQKTLLLGVTFALLNFAEQYPMPLHYTVIMETGGMKGRRKEITRQETHAILRENFQAGTIHSEYGMTELLSQAYSKENGIFNCPPWMKILIRDEDDPLTVHSSTQNKTISGAINVIDLANIYSCSFIATEDAGKLHAENSFEVLGRLDNSDIRGCSLLVL